MMNKEFLKEMISTPSPSGREFFLGKKIKQKMEKEGCVVTSDSQGSIISTINENEKFKVMMIAHMDEISLMIVGTNSDGSLRVLKNGGVNVNLYVNHRVKIVINENEFIYGVVRGQGHDLKDTDISIDIGTTDPELLDSLIGKYAIIDSDYMELRDDYFVGRALDDRIGVFTINEALLRLKKENVNKQVISVNSVGEECTRRGANVTSNIIKPNIAIVVDVTYTSDYPTKNTNCNTCLGKGGVVCFSQTINPKLNDILIETCKKHNIPFQKEAFPASTYTDGDLIYTKGDGIPMVLMSIPLRYMHSPQEMCNFKDVQSGIDILVNFIKDLDVNAKLMPYED